MAAGETVQITMPQMGESVSEGTVLTWLKKEGDWVDKDETVVEVSTDKVDAEIPAPAAGKLAKIVVGEDEVIEVGGLLGEIEAGAEAPTEAAPMQARRRQKLRPRLPSEEKATGGSRRCAQRRQADVVAVPGDAGKITPVARRVAAAHGIDVSKVGGSGTGGRDREGGRPRLHRAQRRRRRRRRAAVATPPDGAAAAEKAAPPPAPSSCAAATRCSPAT